jgi:hypothetical protein
MYWWRELLGVLVGLLGLSLLRAPVRRCWPRVTEYRLDGVIVLLMSAALVLGVVEHGRESRETRERDQQIEALKDYSQIARYDVFGTTGLAAPPLKETTDISPLLEGVVTAKDGKAVADCEDASLAKFKTVIERFPRYPFGYYWMAVCLRVKNDPGWKDYASQALTILQKTTILNGHHSHHDEAKHEIETWFAEATR